MYISAFHIDGFGIFANVDCQELSPGLNIFYGKNEAGKSTCLEFFRAMLTGYPAKNSRKRIMLENANGAHQGGTLFLQCEQPPHKLRLSRSPDGQGGLRLYAADGSSLSGDTLARILSGVDREVYSRIFGFSLTELEQWDKASEESVRNALYGASFGPGLNSPAEAEKSLQKRMNAIFRQRGTSQPLAEATAEHRKLQLEIAGLQKKNADYDFKAAKLADASSALEQLRSEQHELERERRNLERRLDQWRNHELLRAQKDRLAAIEPVPENFPEDAVRQLENLRIACTRADQELTQSRVRLVQLEERHAALLIDAQLLAELPELRRLAERKSGYRQAKSQLPELEEQRETWQTRLDVDLAQLGPGWTCDKIRKTDRSLFARDGMDKLASAVQKAHLDHESLAAALHLANSEVEKAAKKTRELENALAELPAVQAILDDNERELLRESRRALEDCRRNEPRRVHAWEDAKRALSRAMAQAKVFGGQSADSDADPAKLVNTLLAHQQEAKDLGNELARCLGEEQEAQAEEKRAEKALEEIRGRLEAELNAQRAIGGPSRDALAARAQGIKNLKDQAALLAREEERKQELDARISQEQQLTPLRNWTLIVCAILFLCAAGAIFFAHWFYGLQEARLAEGLTIPVNLWGAYAALVCGVVLFASGFSAYGPEQKRRKRELASLIARSQTCDLQLVELREATTKLREEFGLNDLHPMTLEAAEALLEHERQLYHDEENAKRSVAKLEQERDFAAEQLDKRRDARREKDMEVQQLRKRWHGFMQSLGVVDVPLPEQIDTVYERIEIARSAERNVAAAQEELDAIWEDLHTLEEQITNTPVIQEILNSAPEPLSLEEAVEQALGRCSEADRVLATRNTLNQELASWQKQLDEAESGQKEAEERLRKSASTLAIAEEDWDSWVRGLGLASDMTPETVRQAYEYMQTCLGDEESLKRAERDLERCRKEISAFEQPLSALFNRLDIQPEQGSAGNTDWPASLDALLASAEENSRRQQRREDLGEDILTHKNELAGLQAGAESCRQNIRNLIDQVGAADSNELLRLAQARDERRKLLASIKDLEYTLSQAAGEEPLAQFLASFSSGDQESQEERLKAAKDRLMLLAEDERKLIGEVAIGEKELAELETDAELHDKRQKEEMLKQEITDLADSWCELALADALLKEAKTSFEKERQPEIIRMASDIFREITDGRWRGINLKLDDSRLVMLSAQGETVPPEALSRGGQEQAWLAMRLAYIRKHNENNEPLPLIMDEVLVNFDPERARRSAEAFATLARDGRQQILYFTCQPHMVTMLTETFANPALYNVVNGRIEAA